MTKQYDYLYCENCEENYDTLGDHDACKCNQYKVYSELLLSDARGQYIPRDFLESFDLDKWNIPKEMRKYTDVNDEWYWDNWNDIEQSAFYDLEGLRYYLEQDGDLFAVARVLIENNDND